MTTMNEPLARSVSPRPQSVTCRPSIGTSASSAYPMPTPTGRGMVGA